MKMIPTLDCRHGVTCVYMNWLQVETMAESFPPVNGFIWARVLGL
jgi:hypothetical protein